MTHITITSAIELSKTQLDAIKKAIEKKYGSEVSYDLQLDPSLVGGLKLRVGSMEFDHSVKSKLNQIRSSLMASI